MSSFILIVFQKVCLNSKKKVRTFKKKKRLKFINP